MELTPASLEIDGQSIAFQPGESVMAAARRHGIGIPSLCYDDRLIAFGGCRLCVVQVKGSRGFPAACTLPAASGMEVVVHNKELDAMRQALLAMVVSENGAEKLVVDPLRGYASQELRQLAAEAGGDLTRFRGQRSGQSRPDDPNPFILRDYDRCISCYRCVRVCAEQEGDYAISVMNRGFATQITVEFEGLLAESQCTFCGQCVQTCPTGALADRKAMRFVEEPRTCAPAKTKGK